jgi:hypothetical protein
MSEPRIVCNFSCGAASAVACKLILSEYDRSRVVIQNAFVKEEHEDNRRFLQDCERWFEHPIAVLVNEKYGGSTHEVWKKNRYIKGLAGARCSKHLKRKILNSVSLPNDIAVLGYTREEQDRLDRFIDANNGCKILTPLIDKNLGKSDCLAIIERAGIELPMMYRLGYNNSNCIGCPNGGLGYWNKIRRDFPDQFYQIADIQDAIGPGAYFLRDNRTKERVRLRDLNPNVGRHEDEPEIQCSFFCEMAEQDIAHEERAK